MSRWLSAGRSGALMEVRTVVLRTLRAGRMRDRGWVVCGALVLVPAVAAGCTGQPGAPDTVPHSSATSGAVTDFGARTTTLMCADAVVASPADSTALTDQDAAVGLGAATEPMQIPLATEVGLHLPAGMQWYFRKSPIAVKANAGAVDITVSGPDQALLWVPAEVWTSGLDVGRWASSSVTLHSCPDWNALFLGGVLAARPDICVVIHVQLTGRNEETLRQRLNGSACAAT
jgi:hypothetical protein